MVAFSDASHAPMKSIGRRGVTGGVLTYGCCCIKTYPVWNRNCMHCSTRDVSPPKGYWEKVKVTEVPGVLYSDTESALKLLRNLDVPRKNRHLEIRIEWIKERVSLGNCL